jgi:hypothetical protein
MKVYLAKDTDSRDYAAVTQAGTGLSVSVWKYIVASVELQTAGDNSDVKFYVDNAASGAT